MPKRERDNTDSDDANQRNSSVNAHMQMVMKIIQKMKEIETECDKQIENEKNYAEAEINKKKTEIEQIEQEIRNISANHT